MHSNTPSSPDPTGLDVETCPDWQSAPPALLMRLAVQSVALHEILEITDSILAHCRGRETSLWPIGDLARLIRTTVEDVTVGEG